MSSKIRDFRKTIEEVGGGLPEKEMQMRGGFEVRDGKEEEIGGGRGAVSEEDLESRETE